MSRLGAFVMLLGIGLAATLISVQAETGAAAVGAGTQVALTLFVLDLTAMATAVVVWRHPAGGRAWGILAVAFALLTTSGLLRQVFPVLEYTFPTPADLTLIAFVPILLIGAGGLPSRARIRMLLLAAAMLATVAGETYLSVRQDTGGSLQDSCRLIAHFLLALAPIAQLRDAYTAPEAASAPGVTDRRGLHAALTVALARTARGPRTVAVVLTDLDGSVSSEELRAAYGRILRSNVLGTDVVARIGGGMFAIVLHDITDVSQAEAVVARIRDAMREPVTIGEVAVQPRAGFGIAVAAPGETDADTVLHRAGLALSSARNPIGRTPSEPR